MKIIILLLVLILTINTRADEISPNSSKSNDKIGVLINYQIFDYKLATKDFPKFINTNQLLKGNKLENIANNNDVYYIAVINKKDYDDLQKNLKATISQSASGENLCKVNGGICGGANSLSRDNTFIYNKSITFEPITLNSVTDVRVESLYKFNSLENANIYNIRFAIFLPNVINHDVIVISKHQIQGFFYGQITLMSFTIGTT